MTGAGSGIGAAIAVKLAREGYRVMVGDLDQAAAQNTVDAIQQGGGAGAAYVVDVANTESVGEFVARVLSAENQIDVLVNNAGIGTAGTVITTSPAEWDRMFAVNVRGVYNLCHSVVPVMITQRSGRIINMASIAGMVGLKDRAAYSATKGAILALTRAMQADVMDYGIRVNAVAPGTVDTPWIARITEDQENPEEVRRAMTARQPIKRMGTPEEIADAVVFLAGAQSSFVWGSTLTVDGGLTAF